MIQNMPPNPYTVPLAISWALVPLGGISLLATRTPGNPTSDTSVWGTVIAILLWTFALIMILSLWFVSGGHKKRFGAGQLLVHWRVEGDTWRNWRDDAYAKVKRKWTYLLLLVGLLIVVSGIAMAINREELLWKVVMVEFALMFLVFVFIAWLTTGSFRKPIGDVWLAEEAIQFCTKSLFLRTYGVRLRDLAIRNACDQLYEIAIDYSVQGKYGWNDHVYTAPVPLNQLKAAQNWVDQQRAKFFPS